MKQFLNMEHTLYNQQYIHLETDSMLESIINLIITIHVLVTPKYQSCIRMRGHLWNRWRLHITLLHRTARRFQGNRLRLCQRKTLLSYCNSCWHPSRATCVLQYIITQYRSLTLYRKHAFTMISILHSRSTEWNHGTTAIQHACVVLSWQLVPSV